MKRTFVQSELFKQRLDDHLKTVALLTSIEDEILRNPFAGDLIIGTGGVRKMRVADPSRPKGKSGGFRVLYLDLHEVGRTHLLYIYAKAEADNLSAAGKRLMKQLTEAIRKEAK